MHQEIETCSKEWSTACHNEVNHSWILLRATKSFKTRRNRRIIREKQKATLDSKCSKRAEKESYFVACIAFATWKSSGITCIKMRMDAKCGSGIWPPIIAEWQWGGVR